MKFSLLVMVGLLTIHASVFSQRQHIIDSLLVDLARLKAEKKAAGLQDTSMRDTSIIFTLTKLAIMQRANADSGLYYANQVVDWSLKIDFKMGLGDAYNILGSISKNQGNYSSAIDYYTESDSDPDSFEG